MPLTDKKEVKDLLTSAREIRKYCMLTGKTAKSVDALIRALAPFDGEKPAKLEDLTQLRIATRDVCQDIDDYTLTQILEGKSPVHHGSQTLPEDGVPEPKAPVHLRAYRWAERNWPSAWQRVVLPGIAVALLLAAMHFTQWTFQANLLLDRLDDHLTTDPYEEVRDLVLVARAIQSQDTAELDTSIPAQKVFNQSMSQLRAYHFREKTLHDETATEVSLFNPLAALSTRLKRIPAEVFRSGIQTPVEAPVQVEETTADEVVEVEKSLLDEGGTASEEVQLVMAESGVAAAQLAPMVIAPALLGRDDFLELVNVIAKRTGRHPGMAEDHVSARLNLQENAEDLKERIANANRFFLPMIYGALGAALFCLVRILTPSLSDLGPGRAFLRILFGAFAAMTLSMLFIPANIFSINAQSNSTLIFLACFLFGYSFDAVMTALHRMEAFLEGRLRPPEDPKATKPEAPV